MVDIGTVAVTTMFFGNGDVKKIYIGDVLVYQGKTKLATPTNVSITNSTISFDEVEHADSYSIYAGNILVGEYVPEGYAYTQDEGQVTLFNTNYENISLSDGVMTLL